MSDREWFRDFVAAGPDYAGQRMSVSEVQALLLKAAIGSGVPLGHAQDLSVLARSLMSDPQLLAMAAAALDGKHARQSLEGTAEHCVIERAQVLMAAPLVIDRLVCGATRIVLHDMDWPLLLWPYLAQGQSVYDVSFQLTRTGKTVIVTPSAQNVLDPFGPVQSVPFEVLERLQRLAAKTYVPSSAASRAKGAGAGLTDND